MTPSGPELAEVLQFFNFLQIYFFRSPDGGTFPLSDASSLLLRLELAGLDVKERARELVSLWEKHNQTFVSLFYDGHACFNNLLAGETAANTVLMDNMREYIKDNRKVSKAASHLQQLPG